MKANPSAIALAIFALICLTIAAVPNWSIAPPVTLVGIDDAGIYHPIVVDSNGYIILSNP